MRPLRYSINVSLDGCCDHAAFGQGTADLLHRHSAETFARHDGVLFGRVTYQMMESAFRAEGESGASDDPFVAALNAMPKHVVSGTLGQVDWNASLVEGDLATAVRGLKEQPGLGLLTGGVALPGALAALGLIDEYELVVHPVVAGHGPTLLAGLPAALELRHIGSQELGRGIVVQRYVPAG